LLRAIKPETLQHLVFTPRNLMEGAWAGKHASSLRGASPEFIEHRSYVSGDPLSMIDWRAYARSDRYVVRLTEHETDAMCHVMIDCSASMNFKGCNVGYTPGVYPVSKFTVATRLAASLMYLLVSQGDRAGCSLFAQNLLWSQPAVGTPAKLMSIFARLEMQLAEGSTDLAEVLKQASVLLNRRGVVVIISDFYTDPDVVFRGLGSFLHRRDDIILFHLLHPHELNLPDIGSARLQDMESGERIHCSPRELQTRHASIMQAHVDALRTGSLARGIDYNVIFSDQLVHEALQHHLGRRGGYRR
jgi:uncharacterized protein (DUF58 family)